MKEKICDICGRAFYVGKHTGGRKRCSPECQYEGAHRTSLKCQRELQQRWRFRQMTAHELESYITNTYRRLQIAIEMLNEMRFIDPEPQP